MVESGLGFRIRDGAGSHPLVVGFGDDENGFSAWRVAVLSVVFLLMLLASLSFLMFAKHTRFYEEDDARLN